jgi:hypothetical protein
LGFIGRRGFKLEINTESNALLSLLKSYKFIAVDNKGSTLINNSKGRLPKKTLVFAESGYILMEDIETATMKIIRNRNYFIGFTTLDWVKYLAYDAYKYMVGGL